jgi:hypothetical protein
MNITIKWFKEHFLCEKGLADVLAGFGSSENDSSFCYTHNQIIDKYIRTKPEWCGFFCGMVISNDLERFKMSIDLVEKYLHLITSCKNTETAVSVFNHLKNMAFVDKKMFLSADVNNYLDNKENRKKPETFITYILCLYIKLYLEGDMEYTTKILGALVEAIVELQLNIGSEKKDFICYYKAALYLRKLLNEYLIEY